jgi:hypothetical protein
MSVLLRDRHGSSLVVRAAKGEVAVSSVATSGDIGSAKPVFRRPAQRSPLFPMSSLRRALVLVAVLALAACTDSADSASTTTTSTLPPTTLPPQVVGLLGDSQAYLSLDELTAELAPDTVEAHAAIGLQTVEGQYGLADLQAKSPAALAIVLGTNDTLDGVVSAEEVASIDRMGALLEPMPCVLWLEVPTTTPHQPDSSAAAAQWNELLRTAAPTYGFTVVPWAEMVADHPEWFDVDQIHLTEAGQAALADALGRAVARCLAP